MVSHVVVVVGLRLNYLDLYVYMYNEDKLYVGDFGSSVCEKAIIVAL